MPSSGSLRPAAASDRPFVESLLRENDLPTRDLSADLNAIFVYETAAGPVGVGGLEACGDAGLLRSVAIADSARGAGYGTDLCRRLVDRARAADRSELYLLTTTAASFFERLDFERVERARAPPAIRRTDEFGDICPSTAVCMRRTLGTETR